jgi:4-hydroxy-tetrahydrodipicolinate synthase
MARSFVALATLATAAGFRPAAVGMFSSPRAAVSCRAGIGLSMVMTLPSGSLVALATPMTESGTVDIPTLRDILRWHVSEGTDGIVILGTTGEASVLSADEKNEVMAATREEVGGKLPIVVGTGTISTESTIAATKQAKLFGADAALIVTPYYVKPSQAGLLAHFTKIADSVELPIILYNVPGRTGVDMTVETTVALARHPMIQGLKDATGDNNRVAPMRAVCGEDFKLYSGEDAMARDYVLQGGDGVISVTANVAPGQVAKVMAAANAKDVTAATALDAPLAALHRDLFCEANPIPVKWALAKMGRYADSIRLPLAPLGMDFHSRVTGALQQAGCISGETVAEGSSGWPSRTLLLQGHLFDQSLINQALELIEKRSGDFEILNFSVQPNDQRTEFNFRRLSSVSLKVFAVDTAGLDDITHRLQQLVNVLESAEGSLTVVPEAEAA